MPNNPTLYLICLACAACLVMLTGCHDPLSNDQIIEAVRKCNKAGLQTQTLIDINYNVVRIQCVPK